MRCKLHDIQNMNFSIIFILFWNLIKNNLVRSSCMQDLCTVKSV